jgi:hypothetical protein
VRLPRYVVPHIDAWATPGPFFGRHVQSEYPATDLDVRAGAPCRRLPGGELGPALLCRFAHEDPVGGVAVDDDNLPADDSDFYVGPGHLTRVVIDAYGAKSALRSIRPVWSPPDDAVSVDLESRVVVEENPSLRQR